MKGGKEGKALVESFRGADQHTYCVHEVCQTQKNLITINITDTGAVQYGTDGQQSIDDNFVIPSSWMYEGDPEINCMLSEHLRQMSEFAKVWLLIVWAQITTHSNSRPRL
jgi:hypothetical protein